MRIIGNDPSTPRQAQIVASGTLPSGKPVVVNSDGTVSVVEGEDVSQAAGSASVFESANSTYLDSTFDSTNNKFIVAYQDSGNSQRGTAVVGTVNASDNSISFGTPVVFQSSTIEYCAVVHDSTNNKIVIFYHDVGSTNYGKAIVGTVSGTSISFGTAVVFASVVARSNFAAFDSGNGKVVNVYRNSSANSAGDAVVGTVSGTSISFGSSTNWSPANQGYGSVTYIGSSKFLIGYSGSSDYGNALIATLSGTSLSYGSSYVFRNSSTFDISSSYDSSTGKVVIVSRDNSSNGKAIVASISGTAISYGSEVTYASVVSSGDTSLSTISYDSTNDKMVISYQDNANSNYGTLIVGTVSGTSISFGTPVVFEAASTNYTTSAFDTNSEKVVIAYRDQGNSNYGTSVVFQNANITTNLTAENYIGMSGGAVSVDSQTEEIGSAVVFESADTTEHSVVFDSANNKVVIAYEDRGNSNYGTAVVGTVSGTSISFGTPVVFESAESRNISATFDSSNNKVVIAYDDNGNSSYGTAVVGTVSGTSISFGSPVVFESAGVANIGATFDSSNNKVVIAYEDNGNSNYGTAIVGTVSGTSISFGSAAVFESAQTARVSSTFDSSNNKVVVAYRTTTGKAAVGTVSGTSISFGTPVEFYNATTEAIDIVFDSNVNKVVIAYQSSANDAGLAKVGTVSGTSISFGAEATFNDSNVSAISPAFDSSINKVVIAYEDKGNSDYGTYVVGTVSDTSISFGTSSVFDSVNIAGSMGATFDSANNKVVTAYRDGDNSNYGTSVVLQAGYTNITRGSVADGDNAAINLKGAVAENQSGLTAGQSYYVQIDGTLGTTPAAPSVFAGTAVAATKLIVKG
jgi:hypothetical protein